MWFVCVACVPSRAGAGVCAVTTIALHYLFGTVMGVTMYSDQNGKQQMLAADHDKDCLYSIDLQTGTTEYCTSGCGGRALTFV